MKIVVTGATGTVGSEVVRQAIADDSVEQVNILSRRPYEVNHGKIRQIIHRDFMDYTGLDNIFRETDACIWCLGISQSRVSKSDYFTITYEYAVAAAKAMLRSNPSVTFLFLSGQGADSTEKSRIRFAKVKGQTENALRAMPFKNLLIFRPGGIYPVFRNENESMYKKFEISFIRLMKATAPSTVINTDDLAKAMLKSIKVLKGHIILSHKDIREL